MREIYAVTVPSRGLVDVRKSAGKLDYAELRDGGLERCHAYFPGDDLILYLEGDDDQGLLERLRDARSGRTLLGSLETHAWFSKLKLPLTSIARGGREPARGIEAGPGSSLVTAVATYGINPGHEEPLEREVHEILPSLDGGPSVELLRGHGLVVWFEARNPQEIRDVLHGGRGNELQRVLNAHTGYDHAEWDVKLAFDLEAVDAGVLSQHNTQPDRPDSMDPSDRGRGDIKGTWNPPPPFRSPGRP